MVYTKSWISLATTLVLVWTLSGCNSTGGESSTVTHSGSVGDGPITDAKIIVADRNGLVLTTDTSDSTANYRITLDVPADAYPLQIVAVDGTDVVTQDVPDFSLMSVAMGPSQTTANINPFSTLIVRMALLMPGGLNDANLQSARNRVVESFGFGLDPSVLSDPIKIAVTDGNIAAMIKASEAFGETIRRSRDALIALGEPVSGDQVMNALAADMTDGVLDGEGAAQSDARTAAVINIVSAQVLVEAMSNRLKVGNVVATQAMDDAIRISLPDAVSAPGTESVRIPQQMIQQARGAVEIARSIAPSSELSTVAGILDSLTADSLPSDIEPMLPGDTSADLDNAISVSIFADGTQLNVVNSAARDLEPSNPIIGNDQMGNDNPPTAPGTENQPFARPDSVITDSNQAVTVAILDNDRDLQDAPVSISLSGTPSNGSAIVNSDNTVTYTPNSNFAGTDSFNYRITGSNGDSSIATVTVNVICTSSCIVTPKNIRLAWNPTPGIVDGYIVYHGSSASTATRRISDVVSPSVVLNIASDLQASSGDRVCFRVSAYNSTEVSAPSDAICGVI